ncbi:MAG: hypothetical protein KKG75_00955 [Nanoarchaeota archaeon]|nr:hypothetical protein [Nanoarchaeota archaeon]
MTEVVTEIVIRQSLGNLPARATQKRDDLRSLLVQVTDLVGPDSTYKKEDYDALFATISIAIQDQIDALERIKNRNTIRVRGDLLRLSKEEMTVFFTSFLISMRSSPEKFPLENKRAFIYLVRKANALREALEAGDRTKASNRLQDIKKILPAFFINEYNISGIETIASRLDRLNRNQGKLLRGLSHPAKMCEELRKRNIKLKELAGIPQEYAPTVRGNAEKVQEMIALSEEEMRECPSFVSIVEEYFGKSTVVDEIFEEKGLSKPN